MISKRPPSSPRSARRAVPATAAVALALACGLGFETARADTVDATLTTLISGRRDPRDGEVHTVVPVYELVSIRGDGISNPLLANLTVVISGWGRVDPGAPADDRTATGDVDVAYAEGTAWDARVSLRLGRQLVPGAIARNVHMDGLRASARVWRGLGVDAHGGVPVTRLFELDRGDAVAGGRLFWRRSPRTEAGVSFIHVHDAGDASRQDLGLDARHRVTERIHLSAFGALSLLERRLAEADVGVEWRPRAQLWLRADYRRTAPDLFLPRTSIMTVFSEESRDEVGLDATYWLRPRVRLHTHADALVLERGTGYNVEGRVTLFPSQRMRTRVGAELQRLDNADNGFARVRLTGMHTLTERLGVSLDGALYRLDDAVNDQRLSLTSTATANMTFGDHWQGAIAAVAGTTPFLSRRLEIMAKLVYTPTHRAREVTP